MLKLISLTIFAFIFQSCNAQSTGIIFAASSTTTRRPTTMPVQPPCSCVAAGTCTGSEVAGFDLRIINQGGKNVCPAGQVWCCGGTKLRNSCGIRNNENSPQQQIGIARYGAYPWQAALLTESNGYFGSGVLISPNYVLTAAHKVVPYPGNFKVRLGDWDGQHLTEPKPYQEYKPAQLITHPKFNRTDLQNDLALIRLDQSVPLLSTKPYINTACLAAAVPATGTRCWVAGWGTDAFAMNQYQSIMKEVDVPIVDQGNCETRLRTTRLGPSFQLDRGSFLCAGGELGKDACTGDGGAPLVCQSRTGQWEVIGLVAWGIGCGDTGVPGVYVNIPNYRTWITQQTDVSR